MGEKDELENFVEISKVNFNSKEAKSVNNINLKIDDKSKYRIVYHNPFVIDNRIYFYLENQDKLENSYYLAYYDMENNKFDYIDNKINLEFPLESYQQDIEGEKLNLLADIDNKNKVDLSLYTIDLTTGKIVINNEQYSIKKLNKNMSINVKLEVFEGPLDLLLHLIEKSKLNIYDIPISAITDQYLDYVKEMADFNMDIASEFLVMASTLLKIKSKLLLPKEEKPEEEDESEEELRRKLIEYKKFKLLSKELLAKYDDGDMHFYRDASIPENISVYKEKADVVEIARRNNLNNYTLYDSYVDIIKRNFYKKDRVRSQFSGKIISEPVNIAERLEEIKKLMSVNNRLNFKELLPEKPSKTAEIVTFLILLEMMKTGAVEVKQSEQFGEIDITVSKTPDDFGAITEFEN